MNIVNAADDLDPQSPLKTAAKKHWWNTKDAGYKIGSRTSDTAYFASTKVSESASKAKNSLQQAGRSIIPGGIDSQTAKIIKYVGNLEAKSKKENKNDYRSFKRKLTDFQREVDKYDDFTNARKSVSSQNLKAAVLGSIADDSKILKKRGKNETRRQFRKRTKSNEKKLKDDSLRFVDTVYKDLKSLRQYPDLSPAQKNKIDIQLGALNLQKKKWKDHKWYGSSKLTPEKIKGLQKDLQRSIKDAGTTNDTWKQEHKASRLKLTKKIDLLNRDIKYLDDELDPNSEFYRGTDLNIENLNQGLQNLFTKGDLTDIKADFAFQSLKTWAGKMTVDAETLKNGLRSNEDFLRSMKNTPMGVYVDSQIAKAMGQVCKLQNACNKNPDLDVTRYFDKINNSTRNPALKDENQKQNSSNQKRRQKTQ